VEISPTATRDFSFQMRPMPFGFQFKLGGDVTSGANFANFCKISAKFKRLYCRNTLFQIDYLIYLSFFYISPCYSLHKNLLYGAVLLFNVFYGAKNP